MLCHLGVVKAHDIPPQGVNHYSVGVGNVVEQAYHGIEAALEDAMTRGVAPSTGLALFGLAL